MTSEADWWEVLRKQPDDWQSRLVFSDWLRERDDERADGMQALGVCRRGAMRILMYKDVYVNEDWRWVVGALFDHIDRSRWGSCCLPYDWFCEVISHHPDSRVGWKYYLSIEAAESAIATAFLTLSADRQAALLNQTEGALL